MCSLSVLSPTDARVYTSYHTHLSCDGSRPTDFSTGPFLTASHAWQTSLVLPRSPWTYSSTVPSSRRRRRRVRQRCLYQRSATMQICRQSLPPASPPHEMPLYPPIPLYPPSSSLCVFLDTSQSRKATAITSELSELRDHGSEHVYIMHQPAITNHRRAEKVQELTR